MEIAKIADMLHPLERKVIVVLDKVSSLDGIMKETGLLDVEVMRALQWLQNKGVVELKEETVELVELDENGKEYVKKGLPEIRFLKAIKDKELSASELMKKAGITPEEMSICLGVLRGKLAISIRKEKEMVVSITEQGKALLHKGFLEESFLKKKFPILKKELKDEELFALDALRKRRAIVRLKIAKNKEAKLTEIGHKVVKLGVKTDAVEKLTPAMLKGDSWKGKSFRKFDIKVNVPKVYGGRKQHYADFLDNVREKFVSLGFTEMFGPIVETEFWDMDALFMPQFHSARDIHSAYYVKEPKYGHVDKELIEKVKKSHEKGEGTKSKGWGYKFDVDKTRQLILRTQGTALSARMLASKNIKVPGKYFGIARCFRC